MRNEGLGSWPARRARKTPHRTALVHDGTSYTYRELNERSTRLAYALRGAGIERGDRVACLTPNHPAYLETLFACGLLGAVFVPLNTRLAADEIRSQLDDCGARLLLHAPSLAPLVPTPDSGLRTVEIGPAYEELLATATSASTAADVPFPLDEPVRPDDLCLIMYTSGTTGRAKGAMLTHANLTWNAVNVLVDAELAADERALVSAPLFHTAALGMLALPVLLKGGSCVLVESFDADDAFDLIERHGITTMFGVPTMYERMAASARWPSADLSSLRTLLCGGAPVPRPLIDTYQRRGLLFQQGYGMTEASPGVLFLDAEDATRKAGSAGVPHFFTDVRLAHPDGSEAGVGEEGEVLVNGPHVMAGYWGRPEATTAALRDGWLHTGDIARADADGHLTVVDRLKDMIISGGENIYPAEVEEAAGAHPAVAECAVIGVPDADWGEVPRIVVVPADPGEPPTLDDLRAFLAGRLASYKTPRSLVIAGELLPRTASGKLRKPLLRERHGTP
ncbi:long-chain fatty acid--CoA ligase [Streptomyces monticola]|uniref:Long-chain fatty acid--CoA ligase n=1 Tax=Streptomyces monticola TaxID=2666263 RepID=A0ABW2JE84_9ACTN